MIQQIEELPDGYAVLGDGTSVAFLEFVTAKCGPVPLIVTDPPWGRTLTGASYTKHRKEGQFDHWDGDQHSMAEWMWAWSNAYATIALPGAAFYVWGGYGQPNFRPFYEYLAFVEDKTPWRLATPITWAKRRAHGLAYTYLLAREDVAYFVLGDPKKPHKFTVPLLDKKRDYVFSNREADACKSEFYRRTNVWTDVTELMQGKVHVCQKPIRLYEIPVQVHTKQNDWIVDPFAGAFTAAWAARNNLRRFVVCEKDPEHFAEGVRRLRANEPPAPR